MNINPNVVIILWILYGALFGMSLMYGIAMKKTRKRIRGKFLKIAETNTITISDFAGNDVSLEKFCDRLFGPELVFEEDEKTRRHIKKVRLISIVLAVAMTAAVVAYLLFN